MNKTSDPKQQLIKRIHAQAREARMDDETRREGMKNLVGKDSTKDMTIGELHQVSAWLAKHGGKVRLPKDKGGKPIAQDGQSRKLRQLWLQLHDKGIVRDPSEKALASWAKRMCKVEALQWLTPAQASRLIEALKDWLKRSEKSNGVPAD